jgi:hypothetical protein
MTDLIKYYEELLEKSLKHLPGEGEFTDVDDLREEIKEALQNRP